MKKVATILIAIVIAVKLLLVDTYALSAAPIFGEVLVELFGSLLVGSGVYTSEEVSDMSWAECKSAIDIGLASGTLNPLEVTGNVTLLNSDGSQTTVQSNYMEWVDYLTNPDTEVVASDLVLGNTPLDNIKKAVNDIINYGVPSAEVKANWVASLKPSDVRNVRVINMHGAGAAFKLHNVIYYGSHGICESDGYKVLYNVYQQTSIMSSGEEVFYVYDYVQSQVTCQQRQTALLYGDWTYENGSDVETEPTEVAEVGENEEGKKVTLDDIQSGVESLEDTKLDYDSFNDEAIIDLLNQILTELDKAPVVEDTANNTIAEDFAQELEGSVALEVEDLKSLTLPTGIATVFPFCLPFDFAYGLELLAANPIAPKFEIPFEIPAFGLYPGTSNVITLDLAEYSKYFDVGRWVQCIIFGIGLCFITFKVVKGVH